MSELESSTTPSSYQHSQKYWGEERHDDAVYAIYLRKVRYVPPSQFEGLPHYRPIDPDSHHLGEELLQGAPNHLQWETTREKLIKAGTTEKLVESLVNTNGMAEEGECYIDSRHFNVFFATYRAYSIPQEVLEILIGWFERVKAGVSRTDPSGNLKSPRERRAAKRILGAICSVLVGWMDRYREDFYTHPSQDQISLLEEQSKYPSSSSFPQSDFFPLLSQLGRFAHHHQLSSIKSMEGKLVDHFRSIARRGGLASAIVRISTYSYPPASYACDYPNDYRLAQQRAAMFDVGRENCVQIAEQLTFWDAELFKQLLPYQCQGAIWGRRNRGGANRVYSVRATIDQFNAVSQRVMTSVVLPHCRPEHRAKIVEKWIDIARELRALKNFSSLKAVISSLQSEPVHRLKSCCWAHVSRASMTQFKELASIFEIDENGDEQKARCLLDAEGTAKSSPLRRPQLRQNCRRSKSDLNLAESCGSVPYLGSFLTDLAMLDQAHFEKTPEGLWNFEKRRREFDVLAKIKLFQSAAGSYTIPMDQAFCTWFVHLPTFTENECYGRSLEIEPRTGGNSTPNEKRKEWTNRATESLYDSPSLSMVKVATLARMFNNLKGGGGGDSPVMTKDGTGAELYEDCHHRSPLNGYDSSTTTSKAASTSHDSPSLRSRASRRTSLREFQNKHRSNSTAPPAKSASNTLSRKGKNEAIEDYLTVSQFNPYLHAINPYLLFRQWQSPSYSSEYDYYSSPSPLSPKPLILNMERQRYSVYCDGALGGRNGLRMTRPHRHTSEERTPPPGSLHHRRESSVSSAGARPISPRRHHPLPVNSSLIGYGLGETGAMSTSPSPRSSTRSGSTTTNCSPTKSSTQHGAEKASHLARVGIHESLEDASLSSINYKCIRVIDGDRMSHLIRRAMEKHMLDVDQHADHYLVQLLPDGSELRLPEHCNPFYAVAPDPTSRMLCFLLKKKQSESSGPGEDDTAEQQCPTPTSTKRENRARRSNLLRWSSGYL